MVSLQQKEAKKSQDYLSNNLLVMATRLGELQAKVVQLDALGERLSGLAGVKPEPAPNAKKAGAGGPYLPAPMSAAELQREIDRLAAGVERRADDLSMLESRLLEASGQGAFVADHLAG